MTLLDMNMISSVKVSPLGVLGIGLKSNCTNCLPPFRSWPKKVIKLREGFSIRIQLGFEQLANLLKQ